MVENAFRISVTLRMRKVSDGIANGSPRLLQGDVALALERAALPLRATRPVFFGTAWRSQ